MDADYNSNSSGSDSDGEDGVKRAPTKRAATFQMNDAFEFDLGGSAPGGGGPLHAWSFTKLRAQQTDSNGRTSVGDKINKLLDRNAEREKNLAVIAARGKAAAAAKKKGGDSSDSDSDDFEADDDDSSDEEEDEDEEEEDSDADADEDDTVDDVTPVAAAKSAKSASSASSASAASAKGGKAAPQSTEALGMGVVRDFLHVPDQRGAARVQRVDFSSLNLSKPLLRAVADLGFATATPIQAAVIPIALTGADVLANAVTGSGKTAAFMLPILERLLYRPRRVPTTRVVVLTPTRELAAQCQSMSENLARYTDVRVCLIVGGLSVQLQEAALRQSPDIVVATPGRLIDHLRNSRSVHLEDVEVLVLDEADRLLEMGFIDEVREVVRACPKGRQTMLFSATLTDQVNDLARLSLHEPKKVAVDAMYSLADHLVQEFIRIRPTREADREAIVLALCARSFRERVIVFFRSKQHCHRMAILFGLHQLNCAELHGNLTQTQRLEALEKFRDGEVNYLLCTDLASRGLDIKGVETVINYHFPQQLAAYIHRVGRTARAGLTGRSVTLVGEQQRMLLKEVVKRAPAGVKSRSLPDAVIAQFQHSIETNEANVAEIVRQERLEKEMRVAEMHANKANNLIAHDQEIMSRPAKTWFQTEKERQAAKLSGRDADAESGSDDERATAAAKSKREQKEKKKKEDPYAGLTRQQRRRKQAMEAETKEIALERAEERNQRLLAGKQGADSDDDDEDDEAPTSARLANGKPRPVRVTKRDLAAAALRIQGMQNQQKMLAKAIKRGTVRAAGGEGDDDGGGRARGADALGAFADAEATAAAQKQSGKSGAKRKASAGAHADDAGGDYLDMDELGAGVSALSSAARKKLKRAIADPEAQRFSERRRKDPDAFASRYRGAGQEPARHDSASGDAKKTHRVKSKKAFKSKAKHRRR